MRRTCSSSNQQSTIRYTKDNLKIILTILSTNTFTITSIYHLHDQALYVWIQIDTHTIGAPEERRTLRWSCVGIGRATFNRHLACGVSLHGIPRYLLPGKAVPVYQVVTTQRNFRRGRFIDNWYFLRLEPGSTVLLRNASVTLGNWSRGCVLEQDEERNSFFDSQLYLHSINVVLIIGMEHPRNR